MSGNGYDVSDQLGDIRERVASLEAGAARVEEVQGEVIRNGARLERVAEMARQWRDETFQLRSELANRFAEANTKLNDVAAVGRRNGRMLALVLKAMGIEVPA